MRILVTAILLGTVSMAIVFAAGMLSGVVRFSTLMTRAVWALSMTSAATFFIMMAFDLFGNKIMEKVTGTPVAPAKVETPAEVETAEETPAADGFQPMDASTLPDAEK